VRLYHEALSLFYRVLSARPESLECLLGSGNSLEAMGRYADALVYFKKAQRVMNEGKIVVGRSDVSQKINLLTEKITAAQNRATAPEK
jgi:tetratricopeptide (TPR) repeat protein